VSLAGILKHFIYMFDTILAGYDAADWPSDKQE